MVRPLTKYEACYGAAKQPCFMPVCPHLHLLLLQSSSHILLEDGTLTRVCVCQKAHT